MTHEIAQWVVLLLLLGLIILGTIRNKGGW